MRIRTLVLLAALVTAAFVAGLGYGRWSRPQSPPGAVPAQKAEYFCPMHPHVRSDKPGNCPICGMKLAAASREETQPASAAGAEGYFCPMHPSVRSGKPGDCPICGMKLIPAQPAESQGQDSAGLPPGAFRIPPEKQQLIGVTYDTVQWTSDSRTFRATGSVTVDETRVAKVQTRIEGWIDQVYADFTGKRIEKGQPLLSIYSPEMLASQQEYLLALRGKEVMAGSPLASSRAHGDALIAASRRRLELLELNEAQIEEITRTRKPLTTVTLYSPVSGVVMERKAFPKQRVTPDTELYTVADLSQVWIMAEVFENEAAMVRTGMSARVSSAYGGRTFSGRVSHIQPQVDPETRTVKLRIEAANPDGALKPGMFVDIDFHAALGRRLTVPDEAVLDTGLRKTVFVDRGNGFLEPRAVTAGERAGGRIEIVSGLKAGERVVSSGAFLIDSESQLKSASSGMARPGGSAGVEESKPSAPPPAHTGHKHD
jgi:RND family efflux transporter MFP subunit